MKPDHRGFQGDHQPVAVRLMLAQLALIPHENPLGPEAREEGERARQKGPKCHLEVLPGFLWHVQVMDLPQGLSRGIKSVLGLQTFRREKIERQSRAFDLTEGFVFMHGGLQSKQDAAWMDRRGSSLTADQIYQTGAVSVILSSVRAFSAGSRLKEWPTRHGFRLHRPGRRDPSAGFTAFPGMVGEPVSGMVVFHGTWSTCESTKDPAVHILLLTPPQDEGDLTRCRCGSAAGKPPGYQLAIVPSGSTASRAGTISCSKG
ncbi:hypothetical protein JL111_10130 [Paracoccus sp. KCTC 42845]|uniref:Uncharacterized protein n=3 Tax=Paracoccus aerius TaxID=1915382 RepID=A0ABS1S5N8_9RHOB|nr:hypothetical protein [Paracoccus aerius]MBL3673844.1 hypothetical protein [Paracoccus aerius]